VTAPERLFEQFTREYLRAGTADPRGYLSQADDRDRAELQALIEAFLERAPRQPWDAAAFSGSIAERALARAVARPEEAGGPEEEGWPELLPALRARARIRRRAVVERLAAALGFPGEEQRISVYYHQMEQGILRPSGVSTRVLEALGSIVGATPEMLRRAGIAGQGVAEAGGEVFARAGAPAADMSDVDSDLIEYSSAHERLGPDELDRLFTGADADAR